jgi:hypothetical protein
MTGSVERWSPENEEALLARKAAFARWLAELRQRGSGGQLKSKRGESENVEKSTE